MNHLIKIIKGSLIGMGSILPGISGSMIAAILNIYHLLVNALNDFTKQPFKAIKSVWQYIVGIVFGLFLGFFVIKLFLEIAPLPITLLFIGFILGAIPGIIQIIRKSKTNWHHYAIMVLAFTLMILMLLIQERSSSSNEQYIIVFLIGAITAIALIIPGLSGATMLMALGFYQTLLDLISDLLKGIAILDFSSIVSKLPLFLLLVRCRCWINRHG
jgi:putative membrane protein